MFKVWRVLPGTWHAVGEARGQRSTRPANTVSVKFGLLAASPLCPSQRLFDIGDDVVHVLESDGEAHQIRGEARGQLILF